MRAQGLSSLLEPAEWLLEPPGSSTEGKQRVEALLTQAAKLTKEEYGIKSLPFVRVASTSANLFGYVSRAGSLSWNYIIGLECRDEHWRSNQQNSIARRRMGEMDIFLELQPLQLLAVAPLPRPEIPAAFIHHSISVHE